MMQIRRPTAHAASTDLPAADLPETPQNVAGVARPSGQKAKGLRRTRRPRIILIVEDDWDLRAVYSRYLSSHGFQVETATDGTQGVHLAESITPNLIVMDLSLPHVDGWQATRQLKNDPRTRHIPIIACTGHVSGTSVERALEAGCDAYLVKPCLPKELLAEIRRMLGRRRADP